MSIKIKLAKKIHKKLGEFLKKNNNYDELLLPSKKSNPHFIIHVGTNITSGGLVYLEQWLSIFKNSKYQFLVVTRHIEIYCVIKKKHPDCLLSLVTSAEQAESILSYYTNLKTIFYLENTGNNLHFIRTYGVKHIFLGHGDSDKSASMNRIFKLYDEIFVSGLAHIERFNKADFNTAGMTFKIIGRPNAKGNISTSLTQTPTKIVYTPTWEGNVKESYYSSLHLSISILENIRKVSSLPIFVKLHPSTGLFDKTLHSLEKQINQLDLKNINVIEKNKKITDVISENCIYICDISSVITEYLTTQSPIITFMPSSQTTRHVSGKMKVKDFAYTYNNTEMLKKIISNIENGKDPLQKNRAKALNYFIDIDKTNNDQFLLELYRLYKNSYQS